MLSSRSPSLYKFAMYLVERQNETRRVRPPVEFPLTDSRGVYVEKDRRRLPDRRDPEHNIDDYLKTESPIMWRRAVQTIFIVSLVVAANVAFVLMAYALIM